MESDGRLYIGAFDRKVTSAVMEMGLNLIYFMKKFYKCYTFNAICKDNAEVNSISLRGINFHSLQL
jgi:hypothetical protein